MAQCALTGVITVVAGMQTSRSRDVMDFTFTNWSKHLYAGYGTVEMQDSVSERVEPLIVRKISRSKEAR